MNRIEQAVLRADMKRVAARLVLTATMTAALVACGGGGSGDAGTPAVGPGSGSGTNPSKPVVLPTMKLALSTTTVTATSPARVTASLRTATGAPVVGTVVTFATAGSLGKLDIASALTNDSGDATVTLTPASATAAGADTVTATATVDGTSLTASGGFQLAATNVTIQSLTADLSSLPANGETTLTVKLSDSAVGTPVSVTLSSACATSNHGTLTPAGVVSTTTGTASFRFRDNSCGSFLSADTYQATITGTATTQSLSLPLTAPAAQSLQVVTTSNQTIYLKGSGYNEFANVSFKLVDASGNGVPNQPIDLTANVWSGGLTLDGQTQTTIQKTTDANGVVIVRVNSGTIPTPVRVLATLHGTNISTVSSALSIAVGLPSQINFSMAQGTANIEGLNTDGTPNTYTIIASDRMGNPVPDGTAINLVSEGGQVQSNIFTAKDANGIAKATANFASAEPRPADGRVTVLAYALGEESFVDANGNNVYDSTEAFQDLGGVFLDRLYNGIYNSDDQFIKQDDGAGTSSCAPPTTQPGAALFAASAYTPNMAGTCDGKQGKAYVRRAVETIFSGSNADIVWGTSAPANVRGTCPAQRTKLVTFGDYYGVDDNNVATNFFGYSAEATPRRNLVTYSRVGTAGSNNVMYSDVSATGAVQQSFSMSFLVADNNGVAFNPMPAGTVVEATGSDGITVTVTGGSPVGNSRIPTGASVLVKFADTTFSGSVFIKVTSPNKVSQTFTQPIVRAATDTSKPTCP